MRPSLAAVCVALPFLTSACASGIRQAASPNWTPMVARFPYRAPEPLARELRYTYTNLWILNGKPYGKPSFAADAQSMKDSSTAPRPAIVLMAATQAEEARRTEGRRAAGDGAVDALSSWGDTLSARGAHQMATEVKSTAVSLQEAVNSLQRAQANVQAVVAIYGGLEALGKILHAKTTRTMGEWVRDSTGVIGAGAPEGSVLQVNFVFVLDARKWHAESRVDFLAHAMLTHADGTTLESRQGYQLYTFGDQPKIVVPPDVVPLVRGRDRFPLAVQPTVRELTKGDVWAPYLALAMSAALADLQQQVRGGGR